jgi:hypothetical protein
MSLINDALKRAKQAQQNDAPPAVRQAMKPVDTLQRRTPLPKYLIPALIVILLIVADLLIWSWWKGRSRDTAPESVIATTPAVQTPKAQAPFAPPPQVASTPAQALQPIVKPKLPTPAHPVSTFKPTPSPVPKARIEKQPPKVVQPKSQTKPQPTVVVKPEVNQSVPVVTPPPQVQPVPSAPKAIAPAATSTTVASLPEVKPVVKPVAAIPTVKPPTELPPPPKVEFPPLQLQGVFYLPSRPSAVVNGRTVVVGDSIGEAKVQAIDQRSVKMELKGQVKVLWLQ